MRLIAALVLIVIVLIIIYSLSGTANVYVNQPKTSLSSTTTAIGSSSSVRTTTVNAVTTYVGSAAPNVIIISPKNLSTVNGLVNISANVISVSGVKQVQFYIGKNLSWTTNSTPYYYLWNTTMLTGSEYMITVKAYNYQGGTGQASVLVDIGLVQHGK